MKRIILTAFLTLSAIGGAVAEEAGGFSSGFSFDPASVRFGYADGYWDHEHRWHGWPSAREARDFRHQYQDRIYGYRHTRYPNDGWRDAERPRKPEKTSGKASGGKGSGTQN